MRYIGLVLALVGAVICYTARSAIAKRKKREGTDKEIFYVKAFGWALAVAGLILVVSDKI